MFQSLKVIKNVSSFKISEGSLYFKDNESLFNRSLFKNETLVYKNGVTGFQITSKFLYYSNWNNETFKRDLINDKETKIEVDQIGDYTLDNKIVFRKNENYFIEDAINESFNKLPDEFYFHKNFLSKDFYISTNVAYNSIHCFSIVKRSQNWQHDLSSLGTYKNLTNETCHYEVKHFIGVYEGKLIIQLSNATFLFLDIESGEHIRTLHLNEMLELPKPVFYDDAYPAHIDDSQLIWLSNQRLLRVNLDTFESKVVRNYFSESRDKQFRFMSNTYNDGMIYFVADYGWQYVTPSHVGVMDANTGDILWHEQLENTGGLPEAPQVSEDKLYVRTNNKVLHIFEKAEE